MSMRGKGARTHGPGTIFPKSRTRSFHLLGHDGSLSWAQGTGEWVWNVTAAWDVSKFCTCRAELQAKKPRSCLLEHTSNLFEECLSSGSHCSIRERMWTHSLSRPSLVLHGGVIEAMHSVRWVREKSYCLRFQCCPASELSTWASTKPLSWFLSA